MNDRDEQKNMQSSLKKPKREQSLAEQEAKRDGLPVYETEEEDFSKLDERFGNQRKNRYYEKVASGYRGAKLVLIFILAALIMLALLFGSDEFTYANLRYLLRNFGEVTSNDTEIAKTVEFFGDCGTADIFSGKLAVSGSEGVSLYRLSGKRIFSDTTAKDMTYITSGSKYFFIWSSGSKLLYVYNSVSLVAEYEFDYPIYSVVADSAGGYAVLTRDAAYNSSVKIYDADMKQIAAKNHASDHVVAISLSLDGTKLATAAFTVADGEYLSKLEITDVKTGAALHSFAYKGEFPLKTGFFESGAFFAVTDGGAYIYDAEGELLLREAINSNISQLEANANNICIVTGDAAAYAANSVEVLSENGRVLARFSTDSVIKDVCFTKDNVFLLASSVVCVSLEDSGKTSISRKQNAQSLISDGGNVYCVYIGRAELIFSDDRPVDRTDDGVYSE